MTTAACDMNSQAFWNDFMRRPEVKEAYASERRLQEKKTLWLEEKRFLEERGLHRQLVADALEDAPADLKKLISPMFHIRIVEQFLWMVFEECQKNGTPFLEKLRSNGTQAHLQKLRETYHQRGEEGMVDLEKHWFKICNNMAEDEEAKKEQKPINCDIHTLKQVLEFGQECKREGNIKFREGLYEEALRIYTQGDEMMRKWKVGEHLKNENKWLKEYHMACLKNKAQAALKLELFQTALEAADAALEIDAEDHKAWYRKVHAEKGLGHFAEAEASLARLEDVAKWHPDCRSILHDCEVERGRLHAAAAKHKQGTREMLGRAFEAGVFSLDRERDEAVDEARPELKDNEARKPLEPPKPLERKIQLTAALAGELIDELTASYAQSWYQERVRKCARDSGFERTVFMRRLKDVAFEVQRPVLEKWGFEGSEHGVREMTAAIREHTGKKESMPEFLKGKQEKCLEKLYGGREHGMAALLC